MVQLEAKQKARKKEERQSLMGKYRQVGCWGAVVSLPHPEQRVATRPWPAVPKEEPPRLCRVPFKRTWPEPPLRCPRHPSGARGGAALGSREVLDLHPGELWESKGRPLAELGESGRPLQVGDTQADP